MKAINKLSFLKLFSIILTLSFISCDDQELTQINENANTSLSLSADDVVMTEENTNEDILTATWTKPDFGFQSVPEYSIEIDLMGNDFSNSRVVNAGRNTSSKVFTSEELNSILLSLGATPLEVNQIEMRLLVSLSDAQETYTQPVSVEATPFSSILDLSTNLGIVGDATPGGWGASENILDVPFYSTSETNVVVAYTTLRDGEIKFRENNDWAVNYGDDGNDGILEPNGANIPVSAGTYKITVNTETLEWSIEEYSWGIVGDATVYGWNAPDVKFEYNPYQDNWKAAATLTSGEIKFRLNEDFATNYGGTDGSLELNAANNISVEAGHYIITLDLNNQTYELEPTDLWGLTGDATAFGWDAPDTDKFLPDFGINEGMFYANGVELNAGEIKVRQNEAWDVNYGDDGNDGTLELGGANIPATPGIYNVEMNFTVTPPTINFYPWQ